MFDLVDHTHCCHTDACVFPWPAASYNALLEICYKSNDSDRALDVIDRMAADGVEPDDITWDLAARKRTWRSYMRKLMD